MYRVTFSVSHEVKGGGDKTPDAGMGRKKCPMKGEPRIPQMRFNESRWTPSGKSRSGDKVRQFRKKEEKQSQTRKPTRIFQGKGGEGKLTFAVRIYLQVIAAVDEEYDGKDSVTSREAADATLFGLVTRRGGEAETQTSHARIYVCTSQNRRCETREVRDSGKLRESERK